MLFRGPIRPNPSSVAQKVQHFMQHFNGANAEIHTYLATWRNWHHHNATDLIAANMFDNVMMQTEPTMDQIRRCTDLEYLKNGSHISTVFKMYYQSKIALDWIKSCDDYDFIVHTRTDLYMVMDPIQEWFDHSHYVAPHIHPDPWMCDQFGVAPAPLMYAAWDYGTFDNLAKMIGDANIPETVLEFMMDRAGIRRKKGPYAVWQLDPMRNSA